MTAPGPGYGHPARARLRASDTPSDDEGPVTRTNGVDGLVGVTAPRLRAAGGDDSGVALTEVRHMDGRGGADRDRDGQGEPLAGPGPGRGDGAAHGVDRHRAVAGAGRLD